MRNADRRDIRLEAPDPPAAMALWTGSAVELVISG